MSLRKKIVAGIVINAVIFVATYYYFWIEKKEQYFPGQYETAYSALAYVGIFSVALLIIIYLHHQHIAKKK